MSQDYIYAVTRVRARETGLLTKGDLERLMACQTEEECLRVLRDKGWGREDRSSAGEMLAAEEEKTWEFLKELTQDLSPFAPLVLPTDGNNLKAAVKCAVLEASPQGVFLPGGQWAPEALLSMARTSPPFPPRWRKRRNGPAGHCCKLETASCATCLLTGRAWKSCCGWDGKAACPC